MATAEQIASILQQQQHSMEAMMTRMVEALTARMSPVSPGPDAGARGLDERRFRDVGKFTGEDSAWSEWSLKFRTTVKELDAGLFAALDLAGKLDTEITRDDVLEITSTDRPEEKSAMLYNRLIHLLGGPALTLHQSVAEENGLEVWRLLCKRYDPKTTMRNLQLWLKVTNPGKAKRGRDFLLQVNWWENQLNVLKRDYGQEVPEECRVGLLIRMAPDELQGTILEHADRLKEYRHIKDKMVMLLDARERLKDPNAMDVGYAGAENRCDDEYDDEADDIGAVGRDERCYRCGGIGHMAAECPTPKGKGKGREDRAVQGKGMKGASGGKGGDKGKGKGSGKSGLICDHCGKRGHDRSRCWTLHPGQLPWKGANAVEHDWDDRTERGIGGVDVWEEVKTRNKPRDMSAPSMPPGLPVLNRFEALADEQGQSEREVANLEVLMPSPIAEVTRTGRLKSAGKGKITIDSGAAESVMPRDMLTSEPLLEGEGKKTGVRYVAANGAKMENYGEKKVRFKKDGHTGINNMLFQVTDVGKPLASVSKILDKGNTVVFSRGQGGSYLINDWTGYRIPLVEEKGTFVMDVEFLEPEVSTEGFSRQGK